MGCDICEIKNLVYRYADCIDRGNLASLTSLFADATLVAVGGDGEESELRGQDILNMYRHFVRLYDDDNTPHTLHLTSNTLVELSSDGAAASGQSYAIVFQAQEGFPLQPIIGVRYEDAFVKGDAGWQFSRRRIETRLVGDLSRHMLQPI